MLRTIAKARAFRRALACSVSAVSLSGVALAAESPQGGSNAAATVEEVIVTAERRTANVQDVPISVTALSGETLEARGAVQMQDFLRGVPGVGMLSTGPTGYRGDARQITIRGITPGTFDPAFGFYIDDVPLPTGDPRLFDVDRVEVLRGPQGTLYGLGTSGGAIKIITNQPNLVSEENSFAGRVFQIHNGSWGYDINGMYNMPIIPEKLAVRLVGFHSEHGGYIDRVALPASMQPILGPETVAGTSQNIAEDVNDLSVSGFRVSAEWRPIENLKINPSYFYQNTQVDERPTFDYRIGDLVQARETDTYEKQEVGVAGLRIEYALPFATLTSVTSNFIGNDRNNEDLTNIVRLALFRPRGITFPGHAEMLVTRRRVSFVQEVRLASTGDGPFSWLLGAFYQRQRNGPAPGERVLRGTAPGLTAAAGFFPFQNNTFITNTSHQHTKEHSAFGEVSYDVTPKLTLTAGLRYFDVEINRSVDRGGYFNGFVGLDGNPVIRTHSREDGVRPKVSVSYDVTEDLMIYATASEGFRRGGVNESLPSTLCNAELAQRGFPSAPQGFTADSLWNYEAGFKSQFADRRVILNATAFQIDWSKIQQRVLLNCGFAFTTNVGEARSRGFEAELRARPVAGLDLSAAVGYTDAEITDVPPTFPSSAFRAGMRLQNVPKLTWNAAAQYSWPVGDMTAFVGGDYAFVDDRLFSTDVTQPLGGKLESYYQGNLRAGVTRDGKTLSIFVDNITDERPILNVDSFGTTAVNPSAYTLQPRTIGISVRGSF